MAVDAGALSRVHGATCTSGFEAADGCNTTGNYAEECGFGYNNGVETSCTQTGDSAINDCVNNGDTPASACEGQGLTPGTNCSAGDSPGSTPCQDGSGATVYCATGGDF